MPRYDFQFIDERRTPGEARDTGTYPVEHTSYPRLILHITNLSIRPGLEENSYLHSKVYDEMDGEGSKYHYQIAITEIRENGTLPTELLEQWAENCWDWFLSDYLL